MPEEELGVIPIWAINVVDWVSRGRNLPDCGCQVHFAHTAQWGAVPKENSHNAYWWGLSKEGDWSFHPLGQEWTAT